MVRYNTVLLPLLCLLIFLQGCVHGDLDDCPPMVRYAVAFEFTHHLKHSDRDVDSRDRFYDDVKKINLFVFDRNNLVYTTEEGLSPYESNFNIPLDLPMGDYTILAWCNVLEDQPFSLTPALKQFVTGVTTLAEARLTLQREAGNLSRQAFEKLLYGEIKISIPLYVSRIDTIPLINDTKHIRVVSHWDHSDLADDDDYKINYDDVIVRLVGTNAVYNFHNTLEQNDVTYEPYAVIPARGKPELDHELKIYYYPDPDKIESTTDSTCYEFNVLRLFPGNELRLVILRKSPAVPAENLFAEPGTPERNDPDYGVDIIGDVTGAKGFSKIMRDRFNRTTQEAMQSSFDLYENYTVDVTFKYERLPNTYVSFPVIRIQDWHTVKSEHPGWAD